MQYVCYQHTQLRYICSWLQADPGVCGIHTCMCNFDHWHDGCFHISDTSGLYMPGLHTQPECLQALLCILYTVQVYRMAMYAGCDCLNSIRLIILNLSILFFVFFVNIFLSFRTLLSVISYTSFCHFVHFFLSFHTLLSVISYTSFCHFCSIKILILR